MSALRLDKFTKIQDKYRKYTCLNFLPNISLHLLSDRVMGGSTPLDLDEKDSFKLLCSFKFHNSRFLSRIALQFSVYLWFIHSSVLISGAMNPLMFHYVCLFSVLCEDGCC